MKKLKLLFAALLVTVIASSQAGQINQINIVNFTVKNTLPGTVDSWLSTPGALVLTAQKVPGTQVREPMMVLQLRSGSAIICGNTMATAKRIDPFDVRVFNTADLLGLLGNCNELKAGTYTICVQFFNIDKVAISREVCKDFRVEDANVEYSPPTLITPDNGKKFTAQELQSVVTFRWTPLVPKPKEPVTYRLKVWQLMQGQNGTTAMRTNQPIVTKDVDNITQATVSGIYTGPCRPPYLCDYIWQVQALNRNGKPMGNNNGMSEPYTFGLAEEKTKCPTNTLPEDKKKFTSEEAKKEMLFRWTPVVPKPQEPVTYRLKVWQLMQGQNSTQAMRTNQPIVTKDVADITEATVSGIYTGPCRPPYLCDYIWMVEAVSKNGSTSCTGEPTSFSVIEGQNTGPNNTFPEDKKQFTSDEAKNTVTFRWTPIVPKPQESVTYRLKVWQLMQGQSSSQAMRTNKPIVTKDVADITEASVADIYTGPCRPPYLCDYIWEVQAVTRTGTILGTSNPTGFKVKETKITGPENTFPEDKKQFTSDEAKNAVTFRWTPIVPKPQEPVTYRLKVWQLMQGQSPSQAMKTNPPIITRDVADLTEETVSGIYTGPCKPPYLCDYIWSVEAITRQAGAAPKTIGTSNPTEFKIKETKITGPENTFPEDKKEFTTDEAKNAVTFRWTPIVPKPQEPVTYRLKVWQLMQGQNSTQAMRTNPPIVTKDVDNITQATVNGIYTGPCRPPYLCDYIWEVQAVTRTGTVLGTSSPTQFSVKEGQITGPNNTFPEDKKEFTSSDATKGVTFRWTPIVPKPQEPVTYRLKVWQLMQGQNSTEAMRTNPPIVTKDVDNITQAIVSGIYTGPCRPPYLCDYIWSVEAITRQAGAVPKTIGTSNPTEFKVKEAKITGPENKLPEDKKEFTSADAMKGVTFRWTPVVPKPQDPVTYRMRVWQLMQGQSSSQAMKTNPPIITRDVADITEATVSNIYTGPCRPPYLCDYIWDVQAVSRNGIILGTSNPTEFKVKETKITGPENKFPEDKKQFTSDEAKNAVTFRWTPVVPKPREPVTYRLKVWQLMQGQNSTQAMRTNPPIVTKDVADITEATVSGIYTGPCRPPYLCDYVWNVQAFDREGNPLGSNDGKSAEWSFGATSPTGIITPPQNVLPEKDKHFNAEEVKQQVKFKWTAVTPKQSEPVTYRLKVWQLMQGQNGTQAMRTNKPIVTKDVADITEATVSGIYTGPCKPPYLCDFIWNVQTLNREGKPLGSNNGSSEPTMFMISQYIIQLDSIKVLCTSTPGVYSFSYTISNVNPGTANLTNFAITSSVPAGATLGIFSPPIGTSIASGNQLTITGTINAAPNLSNICIGAEITDAANNFWKASKDTCTPVLPCKCDVCDSVKIEVNPKEEIKLDTAGNIIQNNTITITPKPVKSVKAELVYFEYKPESDDCMICNKDSKTYGNFIGASTGIVSPTIPFGHTVNWAPNGQMVTNQTLGFVISMPPTVKCCAAQVKWCIRYVVTFADCTVCNKLVCYTYNKKCDCK